MSKPERDQKLETGYLLKKTRRGVPWVWIAVGIAAAIAGATAIWFSIATPR